MEKRYKIRENCKSLSILSVLQPNSFASIYVFAQLKKTKMENDGLYIVGVAYLSKTTGKRGFGQTGWAVSDRLASQVGVCPRSQADC